MIDAAGQLELVAPEKVLNLRAKLSRGELDPEVSALSSALGLDIEIVEALLIIVSDSPEEGDDEYVQLASMFRAVRSGESGGTIGLIGVDETIEVCDREDRSGETVLNSERYRILERIGRGGMGDVFRVHDDQVDREVAIKLLRNDRGGDRRARGKFRREARITGQLEHPNIVPLHDVFEEEDEVSFFSMKLVRGDSLAERLRELRNRCGIDLEGHLSCRAGFRRGDPFDSEYPLTRRLQDFLKVCDAVAFAHSRTVLHRDLKPSNIMLGEFGEVLVMDWGLARLRHEKDEESSSGGPTPHELWERAMSLQEQGDNDQAIASLAEGIEIVEQEGSVDGDGFARFSPELTYEGDVLGTLAYMAPEQAAGKNQSLDERTDIYCLGATLYEILALFPPFGLMGSSRTEDELDRICRGEFLPPSERAVPGTVPAELEQVVLKAMALNPEVRYQSVGDLQREIEAFLEGRLLEAVEYGPLERLGKWTRRHRVLVRSVAMILILTVGVFLVLGWKQRGEKRDRFQALISQAEAWSGEIDQLGKGERERRFELYLESAAALDQALGVMPGDSVARALRRRVGKGLGKTAMEGRDFMLARRAFEDLERFGLSRSEVTRLITSVEKARDRVVVERRDRLLAMLKDIGGGLHRPGRDLGKPGLEDYIYEASGFRDEQTVELLGAQLDRLVQRKKAGGGEWVLKERELAAFACRVLGRIGLASAVGPLSRWIESLEDVDLILEAAEALGNTRHESAHPALIKAGSQFYGDSKIHRFFQKVYARVPIPVQKNPRTPADLFHRAVRRQREGNLQGALEDYSLAISRLPSFSIAYGNRGVVRYLMKDVQGALADLNIALRLNPDLGGSYRFQGIILKGMNRFEEAEVSFTRAIDIEMGEELAFNLLARAELRHQTGNQEGALEDANRAEKLASEDWRIPHLKGLIYNQRGNNKRALEAFIRVLHLDPGNKEALRACAVFSWKLGHFERSMEYLEKALSKFPRDFDLLTLRGAIHQERGDLEAAIEDFEQCHQIHPKKIDILITLGALYRKSNQKNKALEVFGKLIQLAPQRLEFLIDRGALLESMGRLESALDDFDAVIEKSPEMSVAFSNRGIVHMKLNRPREAKADFERSLDLGSVPDQVYLVFGELLSQMGEHDDAVKQFKTYLSRNPNSPHRKKIEAYLRTRENR